MEHTIDAKGKILGRVASQAAVILAGKNTAAYKNNVVSADKVHIINASQIKIDPKKFTEVFHEKYSGYPGGLKKESVGKIVATKGFAEIFKLAVYGMLPANKLRAKVMKNLKISE